MPFNKNHKTLLLTILSTILIILLYSIPVYKNWLTGNINVDKKIIQQVKYMNEEDRKKIRFGMPYIISKQILDYFNENKIDINKALVLLPPNEFVKEKGINFSVPEPVVFYYYTGIKAKWANSMNAENANFILTVKNDNLRIEPLNNKMEIDSILSVFRQYKITL
ncbi:MAG TPA: hypothetical protein VJY62_03675 [Bacteroidia bacterium]|nr:hypothetical protein [Bacteroidia bacterium]